MTITVVFALAAALSSAVNLMTQHSASAGAPKREKGWRLVGYLFRQPAWLLGWVAAAGAFVCQAVALHYGQLSVVQPILVTELVFVLVLRRIWIRQDVARTAWAAALVVCGALAAFLVAAEPTGGHSSPETAQWLSALLAFGGATALLAALGTRGSPARRAAVLAAAAGLAWALTATFVKTATETLATDGIVGMLTHWPVYALVAAVVVGTLLDQSALHVGPLSASQPLLAIVNPLASIALSIWLFDERFTDSPARIAIAAAAMAALAVGVIALSRTAPKDLTPSKERLGGRASAHLPHCHHAPQAGRTSASSWVLRVAERPQLPTLTPADGKRGPKRHTIPAAPRAASSASATSASPSSPATMRDTAAGPPSADEGQPPLGRLTARDV